MAAVFRSTLELPITADKTLYAVREDRKPTVIFSIVEGKDQMFRRRTTFELDNRSAMKLAVWIADIIEMGNKGEDK